MLDYDLKTKVIEILVLIITSIYIINIIYARLSYPNSLWPYDHIPTLYVVLSFLVLIAIGFKKVNQKLFNICYYIVTPLIITTPLINSRYSFGKFDFWGHISYAKYIIDNGFTPNYGVYSDLYYTTPLTQILLAEISLLTNSNTFIAVKVYYVLIVMITLIVIRSIIIMLRRKQIISTEQHILSVLPILTLLLIPETSGYRGTLAALPLLYIILYTILYTIIYKKPYSMNHIIILVTSLSFMHIPTLTTLTFMIIILVMFFGILRISKKYLNKVLALVNLRFILILSIILLVLLGVHIVFIESGKGLATTLRDIAYRTCALISGKPYVLERYKRALLTLDRTTLIYTIYTYIGRYIFQLILYIVLLALSTVLIFTREAKLEYLVAQASLVMLVPTYLFFIIFTLMYNIKTRFLLYVPVPMITAYVILFDHFIHIKKIYYILRVLVIIFFILSIPSIFLVQPMVPRYNEHGHLLDFSIEDSPYLMDVYKWVNSKLCEKIGVRVYVILTPVGSWSEYYILSRDIHDKIVKYTYDTALENIYNIRECIGIKLMVYFYPSSKITQSYIYYIQYRKEVVCTTNVIYNNGIAYLLYIEQS